jgi:BolA protein
MGEMEQMDIKEQIIFRLEQAFAPVMLAVTNESYLHAGHREAGESINSHFRIHISADALQGMSRVAQHKAIYRAVSELMDNPIHALAIEIIQIRATV